jgi:uncharacterized cupredoxin-like copper-binding protein
MKRLQVFACALILVCSMLALGACGDAASTSSGTSNSTSSSTSASSNASGSSTNGNTSTSNSSTSANAASPQEVKVMLGEMYFKPSMTTFKVGQPYQFTLVNEGKVEHEFTIAPPRKTGQTEKDEDSESLIDTDHIMPGQTQTVTLTFKQAYPAGKLEIECSYPGHYEMGMHTPIVVEP